MVYRLLSSAFHISDVGLRHHTLGIVRIRLGQVASRDRGQYPNVGSSKVSQEQRAIDGGESRGRIKWDLLEDFKIRR